MSLSNSNSESEDTETSPKVIPKLSRALCRPPTVVSATTDLRRHGLIQTETAHAHSRRAAWRTGISNLAPMVKRLGTFSLVPRVKETGIFGLRPMVEDDGDIPPRAHGEGRRQSSASGPRSRIYSLGPTVKGDGNLRPRAHGRRRRGSSPSCPR